jgi:acyl-CoA thioesterase-1
MSDRRLTVVALGDSITNGAGAFGVTGVTAFRGLVKARLAEALAREVVVLNAGVNGDIAPQALERLERDVLAPQPDIVTVMFGVNDAGYYRPETNGFADTPRVELARFRRCMDTITDRILGAGAKVVLLTPLPMNCHYWGTNLPAYVENGLNYLVRQYAQASREVAAERRVPLVDTYAHFESHPGTEDLVPDGIHPNPEGHRLIADLLFPVLLDMAKAVIAECGGAPSPCRR